MTRRTDDRTGGVAARTAGVQTRHGEAIGQSIGEPKAVVDVVDVPPVMPKWDSIFGGVKVKTSSTSAEVPGANRSQISKSRPTKRSSSRSQVLSASVCGTH